MRKEIFTIKGLGYRATPSTMGEMANFTPLKAYLKREPKNEHDSNAVAVYVDEKPWRKFHLGYLARAVALVVGPAMDTGKISFGAASVIEIDPERGEGRIEVEIVGRGKPLQIPTSRGA